MPVDIRALLLNENDRVKDYLTRVCEDLTDEQVNYAHEAVDDRGIGNIVAHAYGALANRAALVTGSGPAPSFETPRSRAEILALIEHAHTAVGERLARVTDEQLEGLVTVRDRQMTGVDGLLNSLAHVHRHVGAVLDTRHLGGFETHVLG
jgi:hypothetical protein